ncbi:MAG: NifU family protein [Candidatus Zixiibacteriota bacterium]
MSTNQNDIHIIGQLTMDPQVCRFMVDRPLCPDAAVNCTSSTMAQGSPLLEALFAINGVSEVLVHGRILTIVKTNDEEWQALSRKIGAAIRETLSSGQPLIADSLKKREPSDRELQAKAQKLLQNQINPYVSSHGGFIDVVDAQGDTVYVYMSGGCQGCASAQMTLRQGVEQLIFKEIPEVKRVVDVTDHTAGMNPYYR